MKRHADQQLVLSWQQNGVLTITLNRPEKLNAASLALMAELVRALQAARKSEHVRAVILTGAGDKAFCAGGDLNEITRLNPRTARAYAAKGHQITSLIENLGKPVIAAINGYALGGGLEIALACHLRIATTTAKLGLPEIKHGIMPGWGGTARIARAIGSSRAMAICLLGEPMTAAQALDIGLIHEVVAPGELLDVAAKHGEFLASAPALAVAGILEAISRGADLPLEQALALETKLFSRSCGKKLYPKIH